MAYQFDEVIDTEEKLRGIIAEPNKFVVDKDIGHIDEVFAGYIAASPFVVLASYDGAGLIDLSPKGDPRGFVKVLDEKTLVFPERPGNRRADTFRNLLKVPYLGAIFFVPGLNDTLRVAGRAELVRDKKLQAEMAVNGKEPQILVALHVEHAFMHCAKCMIRSGLWRHEEWAPIEGVPNLADAAVKQNKLAKEDKKKIEDMLRENEREMLY